MKSLLSMTLVFFALSAEANLASRLEVAAEKLAKVESQLHPQTKEEIRYLTQRLETLLAYSVPEDDGAGIICISDGASAHWEKFAPYNTNTKSVLGAYTSKARCQEAIASVHQQIICISDGASAHWEKFVPFDLTRKANIGSFTSFENCKQVTARATRNFVCASDGASAHWEKFALYDRKNKTTIGGGTSLQNCLSSYPN